MINLKPGLIAKFKHTNKFLIFGLFTLLVFFTSCNHSIRFAPVKYPAAAIIRLLDSTNMDHLTIQYKSNNSKSYKNPFTLISYARDYMGGFIDPAPYDLQIIDSLEAKTFKGDMILGTLTLTRAKIEELLTDKNLKKIRDFGYLVFIPVLDPQYHYVYYDVRLDPSGANANPGSPMVEARPCPPAVNCPAHPIP